MKIAFVTDVIYPFTIGGSEIRNHEIAKRLIRKGHEVHILGAKLWDGPSQLEIDGVKVFGLQRYEVLYKKNGKRSPSAPVILSIKILNKLLKENYNVVDTTAFTFFNCYTSKIASLIKKFPLVFTWQQYFGDYLPGYFGIIIGSIGRVMERLSVFLTKNHLAVSDFVKSELMARNIKEKNIKVIHNGADVNLINKIDGQEKKYDLIFVGRLNYQKNLPLFVETVKILKKDFLNIKVAIVGKGDEKELLESLIENYGLSENFEFLGLIKEKEKLFSVIKSAKVFVLPSRLEGFPLTIVEANAAGLPAVSVKTKHNNTEEYIKNNKNGIIANDNPKSLCSAILSLLENPKLISEISETSKKEASFFNWDELANKQEEYYQSLIR